MKVLIVDDHPAVRALLRMVVAADEVHECGSGSNAVAAYAAHRPDVVLMDIAMPGVDGIAATRQIRALDPDARVVIVTHYDESDLRESARDAGACGYVLKEDLLELRRLLDVGRQRDTEKG